jgi:hypothetical protein
MFSKTLDLADADDSQPFEAGSLVSTADWTLV